MAETHRRNIELNPTFDTPTPSQDQLVAARMARNIVILRRALKVIIATTDVTNIHRLAQVTLTSTGPRPSDPPSDDAA